MIEYLNKYNINQKNLSLFKNLIKVYFLFLYLFNKSISLITNESIKKIKKVSNKLSNLKLNKDDDLYFSLFND